ncbi:MAG: nucleotidyltransferase family protein, partial [Gammaproteobacteria bacterium]
MSSLDFKLLNEDELAITSATAPIGDALIAWSRLMDWLPFDVINPNTQRLAPTIFFNLRNLANFKERERLRGSFKYTWAKTTRLIHSIAPILRKFDAIDLDYRIIKGLAIQVSLNTVGSRTMGDVDILIGLKDVDRAIEIIRSFGYRRNAEVDCDGHTLSSHYGGLDFTLGETHLDLHVAETTYPEFLLG